VAVRKGTKKPPASTKGGQGKKVLFGGAKKPHSWVVLFWLAFAILIVGIFLFNREEISGSIQTIQKEITIRKNPGTEKPLPAPPAENSAQPAPPATPQAQPPAPPAPPPAPLPAAPQKNPAATNPAPSKTQPDAPAAKQPAPQTTETGKPPARQTTPLSQPAAKPDPAAQTAHQTAPKNMQNPQTAQKPAEQRERILYFIQVDRGGAILRVKVNRKLPVSDSPMTDVIQALISGPNGEEKGKGLISLIPPAARILYATVRGDTAYINFSEDFQYNNYGVEGYAGQLRQIVYTATEFPNVRYVQILVEGRRLDYLGEGIWIGSPLNREML